MNKNKKSIILICAIVLLALLSGLGIFFLTQRGDEKEVVEGGIEVFDGYGDISWYDESRSEFTLTTKEELYGMARLSKSVDFYKQTLKLGADIVLNDGNAEDWSEDAPKHVWQPIDGFRGTFDGQGHTISGIYSKVKNVLKNYGMGLFGCLESTDAKVQNLRLTDSYFTATNTGNQYIGSIAGWCKGTISNVYSNTITRNKTD